MRKYQPFVTRFLRKSPAYLRLSWINDVVGEDDYDTAAASLEQLALSSETNLWSHQVEISLAKLGRLASWERSQPQDTHPASREDIKRLDDHTAIDVIQQDLYNYIRPVFEGAIDKKAEVELALDYFGSYLSEDRPSLHEILNEALTTMINRQVVGADDLLDLLTLMGPAQTSEDKDSETHHEVFYQALQVLERGRYAQQNVSYESALRKLIWRRCMIRDDWEARGKAAEEANGNSDSSATETALHYTLGLCLGECCLDVVAGMSLTLSTENREMTHLSLYQPLSPAEALMSESESEVLVSRFRPEQRARIALDLQREDDLLRQYIEAGKLDFWYQNLLSTADARSSASHATDATSGDARARLTWV
jgi:nuclear pore complex protein Nup133